MLSGVCVVIVVFVCGVSKRVSVFVCGLLCDAVWYIGCAVLCVVFFVGVCVCDRVCGGVWRVVADCLCACVKYANVLCFVGVKQWC